MLSVEQRFWNKVNKKGPLDCWEWTASKTKAGYGLFWPERRTTTTAHRFSYELHHNTIVPGSKDVHHICENKSCVNPAHLEVVIPKFNTIQQEKVLGVYCAQGHHRTPETTYHRKDGRKDCLTCRKERSANRR